MKPLDVTSLCKALSHLRSIRRAGPDFDTPARYSFTNSEDGYEVERAIELLENWLEDQERKE